MYVYIWKTKDGTPFYVGIGGSLSRANPKGYKSRNKYCRTMIEQIGVDSVIVELHTTASEDVAKQKEQELISLFGTIHLGTGSLTNISKGGERHETSSSTRKILKNQWQIAEHRDKVIASRTGVKRNLPDSTKVALREKLAANPAMKPWSERNGKDAEFDAKRIAGIKAAQPARAGKMKDPAALALRKERLKATLNSPEHKARRAAQNTPEYRAAASARKKEYWAKKKSMLSPT